MMKISLHNLLMFGHHGIHQEERMAGAEFEISLDVYFNPAASVTHLDETINYVDIYQYLKLMMAKQTPLLETLLQQTVEGLREKFPAITEINMSIRKISPPIPNFRGGLSVSLHKRF